MRNTIIAALFLTAVACDAKIDATEVKKDDSRAEAQGKAEAKAEAKADGKKTE